MKRILFACLIAGVACGADTTGPENESSRWELREINGIQTMVGLPSGDTVPQIRIWCDPTADPVTYTLQVKVTPKTAFSSGQQTINLETEPASNLFPGCDWTISGGNASCTTLKAGVRDFADKMASAVNVELSFFAQEEIFVQDYRMLSLLPIMPGAFADCDAAEAP